MTLQEVQNALIGLGYSIGRADGSLGPKTVKAIKAFQAQRNFKVDGIPGPKTVAALQEALQPLKSGPTHDTPQKVKAAPWAPVSPEHNVNVMDGVKITPKMAVALYERLGWRRIHAVAMVANLMWESGGHRFNEIKFDAVGDAGKSHGAGQWNETAGRFGLLKAFALNRGDSWTTPTTQLLFLDHELRSTERRAASLLKASETIEEAVSAAIQIWRPAIPHANQRLAIARRLISELGVGKTS